MAAKVQLLSGGMASLLLSDEVRSDLTARAGRVLAAARAAAPVATGAYRDGLQIVQDTTDRVAVRIGSSARHSPVVESKTGNLARALDAASGS